MNLKNYAIYFILLTCGGVLARPWNSTDPPHEDSHTFDLIAQTSSSSPLVSTIDAMTARFSKALKTSSPSLTPLLGMASLTYIGYVASSMYVPKVLTDVGLPVLDDFRFDQRNMRTESGFIDNLATGFMKDMLGRTEAADVLRNTSMGAMKDGMSTLKKTTRFLHDGLGSVGRLVEDTINALSPECLARHMCKVGQFTAVHIPAIGPLLRSINTFDLDDFSQALIDGTSIGDCSAVYHECPL